MAVIKERTRRGQFVNGTLIDGHSGKFPRIWVGKRFIAINGFDKKDLVPTLKRRVHVRKTRSGKGYRFVPYIGNEVQDNIGILILYLRGNHLVALMRENEGTESLQTYMPTSPNDRHDPWIIESGEVPRFGWAYAICMHPGQIIYVSDASKNKPFIGWTGKEFFSSDSYSELKALIRPTDNL